MCEILRKKNILLYKKELIETPGRKYIYHIIKTIFETQKQITLFKTTEKYIFHCYHYIVLLISGIYSLEMKVYLQNTPTE